MLYHAYHGSPLHAWGELGLRAKLSRKFKATADSQHSHLTAKNVLNRNFTAGSASSARVSDIIYIQTIEGFLYLTAILDLYDRQVIGWSLSTRPSTQETTLPAWRMALKNRAVKSGIYYILAAVFNMPVRSLPIRLNLTELSAA